MCHRTGNPSQSYSTHMQCVVHTHTHTHSELKLLVPETLNTQPDTLYHMTHNLHPIHSEHVFFLPRGLERERESARARARARASERESARARASERASERG
jgi:hypothetical protein